MDITLSEVQNQNGIELPIRKFTVETLIMRVKEEARAQSLIDGRLQNQRKNDPAEEHVN